MTMRHVNRVRLGLTIRTADALRLSGCRGTVPRRTLPAVQRTRGGYRPCSEAPDDDDEHLKDLRRLMHLTQDSLARRIAAGQQGGCLPMGIPEAKTIASILAALPRTPIRPPGSSTQRRFSFSILLIRRNPL